MSLFGTSGSGPLGPDPPDPPELPGPLGPEGAEGERERKPWYSPSRLKTFLECAKKYEFQNILKRPTRPQPHFDLGTNVHAALREWLRQPPVIRTWDGLLELYRTEWRKNQPAFATRPREELQKWGEQGKAMLRRFADTLPDQLEPLATEKMVRVDFGDVVVGGRVDRVDELPDKTLRVIDYKTGKFPKNPARTREEDLAAAVYARGTSEAFVGLPVSEVEYLYLEPMERLVFPVDAAWQAHKETVVSELARRAMAAEAAKSFPAQPSNLCQWCDFLDACAEGRAFLDRG
ncbi:MAG: RecB family exonuclease [Candidatus Eiseniibacteriota bacterium]